MSLDWDNIAFFSKVVLLKQIWWKDECHRDNKESVSTHMALLPLRLISLIFGGSSCEAIPVFVWAHFCFMPTTAHFSKFINKTCYWYSLLQCSCKFWCFPSILNMIIHTQEGKWKPVIVLWFWWPFFENCLNKLTGFH